MNIKIISPGSVMYSKEGGIFPRLLRYAPLTLSTLASLVPDELKASIELNDEIAKKISLGKMNKFKEENALLTQAWVMEPKKKVQDVLKELAINDLKIREFSRIKIGE